MKFVVKSGGMDYYRDEEGILWATKIKKINLERFARGLTKGKYKMWNGRVFFRSASNEAVK